ncbi:MAG: outer membrane beta-barrel protein [Bacteroidales bacterium]|nr:outer membrane beta-barrel protein [Bacteroidales bacterium]
MRKKSCLVITFIVFTNIVFSQGNFREAFINLKEKDTIPGFIKSTTSQQFREFCIFKTNPDSEIITYSPNDIWGFGIKDYKHFVTKEVLNSDSILELIFIEKIIEGKVSLYRDINTLYLEKDTLFIKIKENFIERDYTPSGSIMIRYSDNKHKGKLFYLLNECPNLRTQIQKIEINERSLYNLIKKYNKCINHDYLVYKENSKAEITFKSYINYNLISNKFNAHNRDQNYLNDIGTLYNNSFGFGFSVIYSLPKINDKLGFEFGLQYQKEEYKVVNYREVPPITSFTDSLEFNANYLKVPLNANYKLITQGNVIPYFSIGINNYFNISGSSDRVYTSQLVDVIQVHESRPTTEFNFYNVTGYVGLGCFLQKDSNIKPFIQINYELGFLSNMVSESIGIVEHSYQNIQFTAGILF